MTTMRQKGGSHECNLPVRCHPIPKGMKSQRKAKEKQRKSYCQQLLTAAGSSNKGRPRIPVMGNMIRPQLQNRTAKGSRMNVTTFARRPAYYTRCTLEKDE